MAVRRIVRIEGTAKDNPVLEVLAEFPDTKAEDGKTAVYPESSVILNARIHRDEEGLNVAVEFLGGDGRWHRYLWLLKERLPEDVAAEEKAVAERQAWAEEYKAHLAAAAMKKKLARAGRTK